MSDCQKQVKLKPCPFCGGEATLNFEGHRNGEPVRVRYIYIRCEECYMGTAHCRAKLPDQLGMDGDYDEKVKMITTLWNRRVTK